MDLGDLAKQHESMDLCRLGESFGLVDLCRRAWSE